MGCKSFHTKLIAIKDKTIELPVERHSPLPLIGSQSKTKSPNNLVEIALSNEIANFLLKLYVLV